MSKNVRISLGVVVCLLSFVVISAVSLQAICPSQQKNKGSVTQHNGGCLAGIGDCKDTTINDGGCGGDTLDTSTCLQTTHQEPFYQRECSPTFGIGLCKTTLTTLITVRDGIDGTPCGE